MRWFLVIIEVEFFGVRKGHVSVFKLKTFYILFEWYEVTVYGKYRYVQTVRLQIFDSASKLNRIINHIDFNSRDGATKLF